MINNQFSKCYKCGLDENFVYTVRDVEMRVCTNMCKVKDAEKAIDDMYAEETRPFPVRNDQNWKSEAR